MCYLQRCCFVQGESIDGFAGCCDLKDPCTRVATAAVEQHPELCADHWSPEVFISSSPLSGCNICFCPWRHQGDYEQRHKEKIIKGEVV